MGLIEEKIKQDLMQTIFTDSLKIYETINTRFDLTEDQKNKILEKITNLNKELNLVLKEIKLS